MHTQPITINIALADGVLLALLNSTALGGSCGEWTVLDTPNPDTDHAVLRDLVAIDENNVWAVGDYRDEGDFNNIVRKSLTMHYDGTMWNIVPSPNPACIEDAESVRLRGVDAAGPDDVWAVGSADLDDGEGCGLHLIVLHWDGSEWNVMDTPLLGKGSGDFLEDVHVIAPDNVWFVGNGHPPINAPTPSFAMRWDGSDFTVIETPLVNDDGGPGTFADGNALRAVDSLAPDDIWAVGGAADGDPAPDGVSQILHWDGEQWEHVPGPTPGLFNDLHAVEAIAPDDVWAAGEYQDADGFHPLFLHWDGNEWSQVDSPAGGSSLVAFASDDIYAGGGSVVHWDGQAWNAVESFPEVEGPSFSIDAAAPCDIWAAGRQLIDSDLLTFSAHLGQPSVIPGDVTGDGAANVDDLLVALNQWGACDSCAECPADLNDDCEINVDDLLIILNNWG